MNTDFIRGFWANTNLLQTKAICSYLLGTKSPFLQDCVTAVRHRSVNPAEVQSILSITAKPTPFMEQAVLAYAGNHQEEVERLYTTVKGVLACTLLAAALRAGNAAEVLRRLRDVLDCWQLAPDGTDAGQWTNAATVFDAVMANRRSEPELCTLMELRDLTHYLLNGSVYKEPRSVTMRFLATDNNAVGSCPQLTLEHLPEGQGFCRHPESLLLAGDKDFGTIWTNARQYCRTEFDWKGQAIAWQTGTVRWNLDTLSHSSLAAIAGCSGGITVGAGTLLLLTTGGARINIGISAAMDAAGNVLPVSDDSILPKARAAAQQGIDTLILEPDQASRFDARIQAVYSPARCELVNHLTTVLDVAKWIAERSGKWGAYRLAVHEEAAEIELLQGKVEIGKIYIEMPLLHEVEIKEKIQSTSARASREDSASSGDTEEISGPPALQRWEEIRENPRVDYRDVPLNEIFQANKHLVLFGPPGSGKSALVQYLTWRLSDTFAPLHLAGVPERFMVPVRVRLRDLERAAENRHAVSLPDFLAAHFADAEMPSADDWHTCLKRGEAVLFLDGLDEVEANFVSDVEQILADYDRCPALITCRTISRERLKTVANDAPVYTPAPFKPEQQRLYVERYPQRNRGYQHDILARQLRRFEVSLLASNPLLLSLICFWADHAGTSVLPATRTLLYEAAVDTVLSQLMEAKPRTKIPYPIPISEETKRDTLEAIAFQMLKRKERRFLFPQRAVKDAMQTVGTLSAANTDSLLMDLRENSRVFAGSSGGNYEFLHPTIQEFLAACFLQRWAARVGFDAGLPDALSEVTEWTEQDWRNAFEQIDAAFKQKHYNRDAAEKPLGDQYALIALLDHKAWLAEWEQVFLFLAGRMADPCALLDLLSDPHPSVKRDDLFHHRLALAVLCMAEIDRQ